jgi:phosphatidylglycerophosphatase A
MTTSGQRARIPAAAMKQPVMWFATGFGAGLSPRAPGTAGTVVGMLVYIALAKLPLLPYLLLVAALTGAGVWICGRAGRILGVTDHPGIVWDEIVGLLITMAAAPPGWPALVSGFALFRLFDILKPWPVSVFDRRVPGGLGVMLDDVMAGLYALACLQILRHAFEIL